MQPKVEIGLLEKSSFFNFY